MSTFTDMSVPGLGINPKRLDQLTTAVAFTFDNRNETLIAASDAATEEDIQEWLLVENNHDRKPEASPVLIGEASSTSIQVINPECEHEQCTHTPELAQNASLDTVVQSDLSRQQSQPHQGRKKDIASPITIASPSMRVSRSISTAVKRPVRLLVASLGNPAPYQNTRHSAGHVFLKSIQSHLCLPAWSKHTQYGGFVSAAAEAGHPGWTLFQSPSMMNTSGVPVLKAYRTFSNAIDEESKKTGQEIVDALVVLHDEMETAPGTVKIRRGATSAKGHNGIKSVQQSLQSAGLLDNLCKGDTNPNRYPFRRPSDRFIKVAVGIGRPEGKTREKADVSAYVLGQLTSGERQDIDQLAEKVVSLLRDEVERLSST